MSLIKTFVRNSKPLKLNPYSHYYMGFFVGFLSSYPSRLIQMCRKQNEGNVKQWRQKVVVDYLFGKSKLKSDSQLSVFLTRFWTLNAWQTEKADRAITHCLLKESTMYRPQ